MADDNVSVKFGADTAAVATGGQQVKGVIGGLMDAVKGLSDQFKAMGGAAVASFGEMKAGAVEATEGVKAAAESVTALREAVSGIGEALLAAFAVEAVVEFAEKMGKAAEQTLHTAQTFGLTVEEVQRLQGVATAAGVPFDALVTGMMRLDKAFATAKAGGKQQEAAFHELGVSTTGAYTQTQLLNVVIERFGGMAAGPAKVAAEMALFGRNVQGVGPLLAMTAAQWEELNAKVSAFGVVNTTAIAQGAALGEAMNTSKLALAGLGGILTETLAPVLTSIVTGLNDFAKGIIQSYESGGVAKTVFDAMGMSLKIVETAVTAMIGLWTTETAVVAGFGKVAFDGVMIVVTVVKDLWDVLANLLKPVFSFVSDAAGQAWSFISQGWSQLVNFVKTGITGWMAANEPLVEAIGFIGVAFEKVKGIVAGVISTIIGWVGQMATAVGAFLSGLPGVHVAVAKIGADGKKALDDITAAARGAASAVAKVWAPAQGAALPPAGTGTTAQDPTKAPHAPKGQGEMEAYRTALAQLEDQTRASTGQWLADLSQMDLDYWNGILAHAKLSVKDREEVERSIADLVHKINGEAQSDKLAQDKAQIDADKGNVAALTADWQKYVDDTVAAYGVGTKQVINAQREMADSLRATAKQMADDQVRIIKEGLDNEVKAHKEAVEQEKKAYQQFVSVTGSVVSSFTSGLLSMAEGAQTFAQTMRNIGQSILTDFTSRVIDPMVEKWLWGQAEKVLASQQAQSILMALGLKDMALQIANDAKKAASAVATAATGTATQTAASTAQKAINATTAFSGGIASMAAAPFPLDLTAPAFAAEMASLASLDIGTNFVPQDMAATIHKGERIIPAADNRALMAALGGGGPWGGGSSAGSGGETHNHYHLSPTINAVDGRSVRQFFSDHGASMMDELHARAKNGTMPKWANSPR